MTSRRATLMPPYAAAFALKPTARISYPSGVRQRIHANAMPARIVTNRLALSLAFGRIQDGRMIGKAACGGIGPDSGVPKAFPGVIGPASSNQWLMSIAT